MVETAIIRKKEIYNVLGEDIEVEASILTCKECGEELFCEELDNKTLNDAYNIYRRRHKLLLPEDIINIRKQYDLSQRSFAKLLGWGDKTINRYENGAIQDKAHNSILVLLKNPDNMLAYLNENEIKLDDKVKERLIAKIEYLRENKHESNKSLLEYFEAKECEYNGYKSFDYEKFCDMVLFFANKIPGLLKTKLMKLLNYADMLYYKSFGISMSGTKYAHLPYGPAPQNFDILFGALAIDKVAHIEVSYENGYENHKVIPEAKPISLSENELKILNQIYNKFEGFNSKEISEYSHKEKGYLKTNRGDLISYKYAKYIELK